MRQNSVAAGCEQADLDSPWFGSSPSLSMTRASAAPTFSFVGLTTMRNRARCAEKRRRTNIVNERTEQDSSESDPSDGGESDPSGRPDLLSLLIQYIDHRNGLSITVVRL